MKKIVSLLLICLILSISELSAQALKFGHIDFQQVLQTMPERMDAEKALTKLAADLQTEMTKIQKELTDKSKEFIAQQNTLTGAVRVAKEDEINSLNQRVQNFPQKAQENISSEEARRMQPIVEKLNKAIADVAKEKGLLYVFDIKSVLYHSDQSIDISAPVKVKLGIK